MSDADGGKGKRKSGDGGDHDSWIPWSQIRDDGPGSCCSIPFRRMFSFSAGLMAVASYFPSNCANSYQRRVFPPGGSCDRRMEKDDPFSEENKPPWCSHWGFQRIWECLEDWLMADWGQGPSGAEGWR